MSKSEKAIENGLDPAYSMQGNHEYRPSLGLTKREVIAKDILCAMLGTERMVQSLDGAYGKENLADTIKASILMADKFLQKLED